LQVTSLKPIVQKWCFKNVDVRRGSVGCCNDGIVCFNLIQSSFEEYNQHENAYFTEADATLKSGDCF
jgi:hypothetical protein